MEANYSPQSDSPPDGWSPNDHDPVIIGRVVCITGGQLIAVLDESVCGDVSAHELRKGAIVKLLVSNMRVFGIVTGLSIPVPEHGVQCQETFLCEVDLVGEAPLDGGSFRRGVSVLPALGKPIYLANDDDMTVAYQTSGASAIPVGTIFQSDNRRAMLSMDGLLGKHLSVVGTTGSGKSCAVAMLLQRIIAANSKAHILMLDPHSEYSVALEGLAEVLTPTNLDLPYWLLTGEEVAEVLRGGRRDSDHMPEALAIFKEMIPIARRSYFRTANPNTSDTFITVDTPMPYNLREIIRLIDDQMGSLDKVAPLGPYRWLKSRIETLRADSRYSFMFGGMAVRDTMADILSRLFRIPVGDKPVTIVDLSGMPAEVLNVVVSVLSRMCFDFALWSQGMVPILLVCEEAHRYVPADSRLGFEPTREALARIAKEGRKYGVSLAVVTQRPSEIDQTILSQCNTVIAFRISSTRDQEIVRGIVTDSAFGLFDFLPSLGNGEAIIAGEAVTVPQRVRIDMLPPEQQPRSSTAIFSKSWANEAADRDTVVAVVDRWRRQVR